MGEMRQMGLEGDTRVEWDPSMRHEVEAARQNFDKLISKGYYAYRVSSSGERGEMIREFDPNARKIIMAPQMAGGGS